MSSYNSNIFNDIHKKNEITTTHISQLPVVDSQFHGNGNNTHHYQGGGPPPTIKVDRTPRMPDVNTIYETLNVHPNPYLAQEDNYKLPSRDIPQNPNNYTIDPNIHANYIPPPPRIDDYLRDTEIITNKRIKKHQEKQKRKANLLDIFSDLQFAIYISLLFFIFQLPIINVFFVSVLGHFQFFFYPDGNFNIYGLCMKSFLFGCVYYIIQKLVDSIVIF